MDRGVVISKHGFVFRGSPQSVGVENAFRVPFLNHEVSIGLNTIDLA